MKLFLLSLLLLLNIALLGQNEITYYAPLFGKLKVDTTEWSLPREEPFAIYYFMKPSDYGRNFGKLIHKSTEIRVFFQTKYSYGFENGEMKFFPHDSTATLVDISFHPNFLTYTYGRRKEIELVAEIRKGIFFRVSTDAKLQDTLQMAALKDLMSSFSFVEPSEIDRVMGYPLTKENLGQNFRNRLINEFVGKRIVHPIAADYAKLTANPLDTSWFDEHYFLEKKFDFSFQKIYDLRLHDINRDFSKDDYLSFLFSENQGSPYALYDELNFAGELKRNENLEVAKYLAEGYSKVAKLPTVFTKYLKDAELGVFMYNDSAWNILYAEKELNEKGTLIWKNYDHFGKRGYIPITGAALRTSSPTCRDKVNLSKSVDFEQFIVITNYSNKKNKAGLLYQTLPSESVMNNAFKKQKLTTFSTPTNIANYKVIMLSNDWQYRLLLTVGGQDCGYEHAEWGTYRSDSLGRVICKLLITSNLASVDTTDTKQIDDLISTYPMNQRVVVSPVIESDLDEDGNREVYRVFISNGEIVHYEIYEQSNTGLFKMELSESIKSKISKHDFVARLIVVSEEPNFYLLSPRLNENIGESSDVGIGDSVFISSGVTFISDEESVGEDQLKDVNEVQEVVDERPIYPGGEVALMMDIKKNLIYPDMEKRANIQGTVFINFVVEIDGSISHIKVIKEVNGAPGLTREAERVVMTLKIFEQPAKKDGKPVRYSYNIPVKFVIK
jgi:TonB family protein